RAIMVKRSGPDNGANVYFHFSLTADALAKQAPLSPQQPVLNLVPNDIVNRPSPSAERAQARRSGATCFFAEREFEHLGTIELERGDDGEIRIFMPQTNYR